MTARRTTVPDALEECRRTALSLLDARPYTRRRLAEKLRARGFSPVVVNAVLDDLERTGLINDLEYARAYVAGALDRRATPVGTRKVLTGLLRRGVSMEIARQALAEFADSAENEGGEIERALKAARDRWRRILRETPNPGPRERARLMRFLASRGFPPDVVREAADRVTSRTADDE